MITKEVLEKLSAISNEGWERIIYKLTLHTCWLMNISSKEKEFDVLSGGIQVKDIVQDAISKVWSGVRSWDPVEDPDLLEFLKWSVIKSLVNNYYKSGVFEIEVSASTLDSNSIIEEESSVFLDSVESKEPLADEEMFAKEILATIRKNLEGDDEAALVFEELITGSTPIEISKDLGIAVNDVNNALKRIRNTKAKQFKPESKS